MSWQVKLFRLLAPLFNMQQLKHMNKIIQIILINKKFNSSSEMCDNILNETGVALLPGSDFGFEQKKMLARLSFTDFDGEEFMKTIKKLIMKKLISLHLKLLRALIS